MKNILTILILVMLHINLSYAQNYKGIISNSDMEPVGRVTVFIEEIKQGLVSNKEGLYQLSLAAGTYSVTYKHPQYKDLKRIVQIKSNETLVDNIVLEKDTINNIIAEPDSEKVALSIINNVISRTTERMNAVNSYKANSYIKGELQLNEISSLIDKVSYKFENYRLSELRNKIISQEIYNEIEYVYPDKYNITVKGYSGNIPEDFNSRGAISLLAGSIYADRFNGFISPFNYHAPDYYRYKYEGFYKKENYILHKIKVESKIKDSELLNGYLYIVDSSWYVEYSILINGGQGVKQTTYTTYNNFRNDIYLPISQVSDINFNIFGTGGNTVYSASIKYNSISDKNNGHAFFLEEESYEEEHQTQMINFDKEAYNKNATYWDTIRVIPYTAPDSIGRSFQLNKDNYKPSNFWAGKILFGDYLYNDPNSKWSIRYSGVKEIFRDYNYVDGFWLGQKFIIKNQLSKNRSLDITPYIYYLTGRNRIIGWSDFSYNYMPKKRGRLTLSLGSRSQDFNSLSVTRYQNYFMSLFFGENYNFLYQKDYASISNKFNPSRKFMVSTLIGTERRYGLYNHTDFRVFNRNHIKPNIYPDDRFDHTYYAIGLSYSPSSFTPSSVNYEIIELEKRNSLAFHLEYQEGFSSWQKNNSKYRKLKGGIIHNIRLDYFNRVDYKIEAGGFLGSKKNLHFADYQHFGASDLLINLNSLFDSFLLSGNYELQTQRYWVNIFLNYSGKYFLIKRLPFLQGKPFYENVHIKTLITPENDLYNEFGYSLSLTRALGIGTFLSFSNMQCKNIGIRFSLNIKSLGFN